MPQHIKDIQDGLQYRNDDLQIRGINGLLGPTYLKRGVGEPSPARRHDHEKEVGALGAGARRQWRGPPGQGVPDSARLHRSDGTGWTAAVLRRGDDTRRHD